MHAAVERSLGKTAVSAGNDIFPADAPRQPDDALAPYVRVLDHFGRMADDAGHQHLAGRQFGSLRRATHARMVARGKMKAFEPESHARSRASSNAGAMPRNDPRLLETLQERCIFI